MRPAGLLCSKFTFANICHAFFWGRALLPPSLKRGSTLHQPAHEQILDHRHKCTCLMKPGEETYLDILAGSASVGAWVWHNS